MEILYNLEIAAVPKVVDFSLDYLRAGRYKTIYARCKVLAEQKADQYYCLPGRMMKAL